MDAASRQLQSKFSGARALLDKAPGVGVSAEAVRALANELAAVELRFSLQTSHLYIRAAGGEADRIEAATEFARALASEDYAGDVDKLVARTESALRAAGVPLRDDTADAGKKPRATGSGKAPAPKRGPKGATTVPVIRPAPALCAEIQRVLDVYPRGMSAVSEATPALNHGWCYRCDVEMATDAGRSEKCCGKCGATAELVGTVFDDSQFYSQEGQKAKSGTFNPNRHFQHWWTHITAREPEEEIGDANDPDNLYGEKLIARLSAIAKRDRHVRRLITINHVRMYLREIERTDLNKNAALIMKKLTKVGPPCPPDSIMVRVENLFTKAIEIDEQIRRTDRVNRNYYPFYIYKIIEDLIPPTDYENRRLLYYIYVQSKETVEADDDEWEQICDMLTEINYRPTDRTLGLKYAPL